MDPDGTQILANGSLGILSGSATLKITSDYHTQTNEMEMLAFFLLLLTVLIYYYFIFISHFIHIEALPKFKIHEGFTVWKYFLYLKKITSSFKNFGYLQQKDNIMLIMPIKYFVNCNVQLEIKKYMNHPHQSIHHC